MPSRALEVNIESSKVDVKIKKEYILLRDVMSRYSGILENINVFITELCHPYKNWSFIVREARSYSLDYFHLLAEHREGPDAAKIFINIFSMTTRLEPYSISSLSIKPLFFTQSFFFWA